MRANGANATNFLIAGCVLVADQSRSGGLLRPLAHPPPAISGAAAMCGLGPERA
jgi:hypothetical protein